MRPCSSPSGRVTSVPAEPSGELARNKAVVLRIYDEVLNRRFLHVVPELFGLAVVDHCRYPGAGAGLENIIEGARLRRSAFPDLTFSVDDLVAEREMVTARWVMRGTHQGEFMGCVPTGRAVEWRGITQFRLHNGRVVERWLYSDDADLIRQLSE